MRRPILRWSIIIVLGLVELVSFQNFSSTKSNGASGEKTSGSDDDPTDPGTDPGGDRG